MRRAAAFALVGVLAAIGSPASACSMMPGYKVPTNLELAATADAIVVASITGERPADDAWRGTLLLAPTTVVKGIAPSQIEMPGATLAHDDRLKRLVVASALRELRRPNPGALIGGCVRYIFAPTMQLVLFLKRNERGDLVPYRSSFSRDAEDVTGSDALWVKAVREYAAIGALPRQQWKARLAARAVELRAAGDADSLAIADDMDIERKGKRLPPFD